MTLQIFREKWTMMRLAFSIAILLGLGLAPPARADDAEAIARGKKALQTRAFSPAPWPFAAYDNAWKAWEPKLEQAPDNYDQAFRDRYGLHAAPFDNGKYPM